MTLTNDTETHHTSTAVVTVRIPDGTDGDLTTEATRRLIRADGVRSATIDSVRALSPGLSATALTARVTVELTCAAEEDPLDETEFVTVEHRC